MADWLKGDYSRKMVQRGAYKTPYIGMRAQSLCAILSISSPNYYTALSPRAARARARWRRARGERDDPNLAALSIPRASIFVWHSMQASAFPQWSQIP